MNETEAKLFLLDLGTGVQNREFKYDEMVTEMQRSCNIKRANALRIRAEFQKGNLDLSNPRSVL